MRMFWYFDLPCDIGQFNIVPLDTIWFLHTAIRKLNSSYEAQRLSLSLCIIILFLSFRHFTFASTANLKLCMQLVYAIEKRHKRFSVSDICTRAFVSYITEIYCIYTYAEKWHFKASFCTIRMRIVNFKCFTIR